MSIWKRLSVVTAGATFVTLGSFGSAQAITLSNGSLSVDIRSDNGAIDTVLFGGSDFYNRGTPVSDFGLQNGTNTGTFSLNNTNGGTGQPVSVSSSPSSVTATGTYARGGANISFTRTYSLVQTQNVLRVATNFTNNGPATTLSYFDTFDPDQGFDQGLGFSTNNDVFNLSTVAGTAKVGQASISTGLTALTGFLNGNATAASGNPFQISNGSALNSFFSSPFDGNGATADSGTHIGIRQLVAAGGTQSFVYDQAYGLTPDAAQAAFIAANSTPVPFEFSPGVGILALGICGAVMQLKNKVRKWKFSGSEFSKNVLEKSKAV